MKKASTQITLESSFLHKDEDRRKEREEKKKNNLLSPQKEDVEI